MFTPSTELKKVNDFKANEISINLEKIKLLKKDIRTEDLSLDFWHLSKEIEKDIQLF